MPTPTSYEEFDCLAKEKGYGPLPKKLEDSPWLALGMLKGETITKKSQHYFKPLYEKAEVGKKMAEILELVEIDEKRHPELAEWKRDGIISLLVQKCSLVGTMRIVCFYVRYYIAWKVVNCFVSTWRERILETMSMQDCPNLYQYLPQLAHYLNREAKKLQEKGTELTNLVDAEKWETYDINLGVAF